MVHVGFTCDAGGFYLCACALHVMYVGFTCGADGSTFCMKDGTYI